MDKQQIYQGLTDKEVEESRRLHGINVLTEPPKTPLWKLFLEKLDDPIIKILMTAWALSLLISCIHYAGMDVKTFHPFLEPLGILFAIVLATCVGFFFEMRANKAFNVLNTSNDEVSVNVFRNGHMVKVSRKDIVVGDVVSLETGNEIPADGLLLSATSMQVNESALTGEPMAEKTTNAEYFDHEATYSSNEVMRGTSVLNGHGIMQVKKVGDNTAYGKVYEGAQIENTVETPLQLQLKKLAGIISKVGYAIAVLIFIALMSKVFISNEPASVLDLLDEVLKAFMIAVTLIVMAVPEGLPMSVTLSLALSMNRMLKTNNLVRKMHACETMGATTVICTDKTGTLTQNLMQVHETNFFGLGDRQELTNSGLSTLILEGIAANTTAFLDVCENEAADVKAFGNPTESALLLWMHKNNKDYMTFRSEAKMVDQLTFSTENKYMATIVESPLRKKKVLYVKGAPEILMNMSDSVLLENDVFSPMAQEQARIQDILLQYQSCAMRTMGFAFLELEAEMDGKLFETGKLHGIKLVFLGVAAISDPIREDVPEAVKACIGAGIEVKIVTGDTLVTAREIGRQIGIWDDTCSEKQIITGTDFENLPDDEAAKRVKELRIMCRARPTDKQRLVRLLQQDDAVVAVTGDGTNDAPALNAAQVGLSMGDGTSVAKEVSDITILDNSFSSITKAVMWGRSLYRNIQRFLLFQLTINVAACLIVLIGSLIGSESPLTITQMLWVNLIMDTFAAGALASLPPSMSVMKHKPRKSGKNGDFIISREMALNIFVVGIAFVAILLGLLLHFHMGDTKLTAYELSYFFTVFVMLQFWNLFNAKAFLGNRSAFCGLWEAKGFLFVTLLILVMQYLIVTFGGTMFSVTPLAWKDWGIIIGSTSIVLWVGEIARFIKRAFSS